MSGKVLWYFLMQKKSAHSLSESLMERIEYGGHFELRHATINQATSRMDGM